jgi:hypothetical protein
MMPLARSARMRPRESLRADWRANIFASYLQPTGLAYLKTADSIYDVDERL